MRITDFPIDNLGSPDLYIVETVCRRIFIREKDRSVATLATYAVYAGLNQTGQPQDAGETFLYDPGRFILPGEKIGLAALNVASTVMSIREE